MEGFTEEWLLEYREKQRQRNIGKPQSASSDHSPPDPGLERDLLGKMIRYCKEHGYPHHHDNSRGVNEAGFLDLVIALPEARTLWIEAKNRTGRLTPEQKLTIRMLQALGHEVYEIRSYRRFLEVIAMGMDVRDV